MAALIAVLECYVAEPAPPAPPTSEPAVNVIPACGATELPPAAEPEATQRHKYAFNRYGLNNKTGKPLPQLDSFEVDTDKLWYVDCRRKPPARPNSDASTGRNGLKGLRVAMPRAPAKGHPPWPRPTAKVVVNRAVGIDPSGRQAHAVGDAPLPSEPNGNANGNGNARARLPVRHLRGHGHGAGGGIKQDDKNVKNEHLSGSVHFTLHTDIQLPSPTGNAFLAL